MDLATLSQAHDELTLEHSQVKRQNQQYETLIGDLKLRVAQLTGDLEDQSMIIEELRKKFAK